MKNISTQQSHKTDGSMQFAHITMCFAIIVAGLSIGSAILGYRLYPKDDWLSFLQGIPLIFATLASGAAVASSFFYNQLQYDAQTKELIRQRYERMVNKASEMRIFLLLKRNAPSDPMVMATDSRAAVNNILKSITPYLSGIDNIDKLKNEANKIILHRDIINESQYIQHLFRLSSIAENARLELNDQSIADYVWVQLYPEEYLLCTILIAAGKPIVKPSIDQFNNLQFVLSEMVPWKQQLDLKSLFTT